MGTHWELEGNKGKVKKNPPTPPKHTKNLKEKKSNQGTLSAC
jgi:hypothetical protein